MESPLNDVTNHLESAPACHDCPAHCCSLDSWDYPPSPLGPGEVRAISGYLGHDRYLDTFEGQPVIRVDAEGYCVLLDQERRHCTVYPVRPLDCRTFPFDFFALDEERAYWVKWKCPLSALFDEAAVERQLSLLEEAYPEAIRAIWFYGTEDYLSRLPAQWRQLPRAQVNRAELPFTLERRVRVRRTSSHGG